MGVPHPFQSLSWRKIFRLAVTLFLGLYLQRKLGSESVKTQFSKIYFLQMYFLMAMNSHTCLVSRL
jgi:hypothetical protein